MTTAVQATIAVLPPGRRELELHEVSIASLDAYEVVVAQRAFGVCHSQLDRINRPDRTEPMVLGHESIGTVVATGECVEYVSAGDEVIVTWVPRSPLLGRRPVPSKVALSNRFIARSHNSFTWGTHAVVDEQYLVKAPAGASRDLGSIIGCALMTGAGAVINSAKVQPGQTVAVWGAGGVGLCAVAAASIAAAAEVIAIDVDDDKLKLAAQFGATEVINAKAIDPVDGIRNHTVRPDGTRGVDYSFDCTGIGANIALSLAAVRPGVAGTGVRGGTNVIVGIPRVPFELDSLQLIKGERALIGCEGGSCDPQRDFPIFVDWSLSGQFDPSALVTNRYALNEINTAVDDLHHGRVSGRAVIEL